MPLSSNYSNAHTHPSRVMVWLGRLSIGVATLGFLFNFALIFLQLSQPALTRQQEHNALPLAIIAEVLAMALAVFLLAAGLRAQRPECARRAAELHWQYAGFQIMASVFAAVAFALDQGGNGSGDPLQDIVVVIAILFGLTGCLYPIVILLSLRTFELGDVDIDAPTSSSSKSDDRGSR